MLKRICLIVMSLAIIISTAGCGKEQANADKKTTSSGNNSSVDSKTSSIDDSVPESSSESSSSSDIGTASASSEDGTTSQGSKTITTTVPKRTKPVSETKTIKKEFTLEGDTTVKDEIKLGKYKYVWGDEFDGTELDANKWHTRRNSEQTYDVTPTGPIEVKNGCLNLIATRYYDPTNDSFKWQMSPSLQTRDTMNYRHGYLEFRAKVPLKKGTWPSFWLKSDKYLGLVDAEALRIQNDCPYHIEVDIFESHGNLDMLKPNIHKWYTDGTGRHSQAVKIRNNYIFEDTTFVNEEYHVYGYLWDENEMSMFVDGEKYCKFDLSYNFNSQDDMRGFVNNFQYIIFSNGLISPAAPAGDSVGAEKTDEYEPTDFPVEYSIDWVRLYQDENDPLTKLYTK